MGLPTTRVSTHGRYSIGFAHLSVLCKNVLDMGRRKVWGTHVLLQLGVVEN